ncbi:hypothetical protein JB92DRAFT_3147761 [Gautieria morchelliformis]|nr:hypothetical protein JB92DRAFT_3147761 [Gautieria morchelliformis]
MSPLSSPIYYGYDASPFVSKLETVLLLRNIPARRVQVALTPPRPELSTLLGIPYRRVPLLALGRDVYVDTFLVTAALERHFPAPRHPTIFPARRGKGGSGDVGLQKAFGMFYGDKNLFGLGFRLLPWTRVPRALQEDRKKFMGRDVDFEALAQQQSVTHSTLASHLALIEEQLADGRTWFLDTDTPGYADVSLHFALTWMRSFRATRPVFAPAQYPFTVAWLNNLDALLTQKRAAAPHALTKISGADAARAIFAAPVLDPPLGAPAVDPLEATRLALKPGARVSVRPDDTGKEVETIGTLVALSREEVVLETEARAAPGGAGPAALRVHFPRLGYVVVAVGAAQTEARTKL